MAGGLGENRGVWGPFRKVSFFSYFTIVLSSPVVDPVWRGTHLRLSGLESDAAGLAAGLGGRGRSSGRHLVGLLAGASVISLPARGFCDHSEQLLLCTHLYGPPLTPSGVSNTVRLSGSGLLLTAAAAGAAGRLYSGGRCRPAGTQECSRRWAGWLPQHNNAQIITGKISSY